MGRNIGPWEVTMSTKIISAIGACLMVSAIMQGSALALEPTPGPGYEKPRQRVLPPWRAIRTPANAIRYVKPPPFAAQQLPRRDCPNCAALSRR